MSRKLQATLSATLTLVDNFQLALASPTKVPSSSELSGKDALPLLSASSAALKSHVTKLSLLAITSPFTHSAVGAVLNDLNESVLPSLVTAGLLVNPTDHTQAFHTETQVLVKTSLNELMSLAKEVRTVAAKKDGAKKAEDLSQSEKDSITMATGRVWDACDALIDLASIGVVGFVVRRVEEWRDLVRDAVEEIEEWNPDEGDDFFDELMGDDKWDTGPSDGDESGGDSEEKDTAILHERKRVTIRLLKPVAQIYPAIITNRLKTIPELSHVIVSQLESVMTNLQQIPEQVDEVAGALYEASIEESAEYLKKTKDHAVKAVNLVASSWNGQKVADAQQAPEDKFSIWSKTWLRVMNDVSRPVDDVEKAKH
ncbi:hypothetical protein BDV25DRAFT_163209 [Aspergillus avenaceus]|uniref:Cyclin-D1-binding protein 1-like N-terminal domain-containing protein n=1 Tax=Aspergillus avenaceus TaxID=36643 RepID=A0A5N6TIA3_ASPAV|nr:hypothetical protein BDV25DRAFT_163209 [Aspergillus avenaceus]